MNAKQMLVTHCSLGLRRIVERNYPLVRRALRTYLRLPANPLPAPGSTPSVALSQDDAPRARNRKCANEAYPALLPVPSA